MDFNCFNYATDIEIVITKGFVMIIFMLDFWHEQNTDNWLKGQN